MSLFFTGRALDPAIFIRNATTGEGFAILMKLRLPQAHQNWIWLVTRTLGHVRHRSFSRLNNDDSAGIVVLFRNQSSSGSAQIQIVAPEAASYSANSVLTGEQLGQATAEQLSRGWNLNFPLNHPVEILELDRTPGH